MGCTDCILCCVQGRPNVKSTLDGWRSAGEPRAPELGLFVIFCWLVFVRSFAFTKRMDKRKEREKNGAEERSGKSVFLFVSFARQEEFRGNTQLMADFVFNYSDCLKIRGSPHWLFCQMPSYCPWW